MFLPDDRTIVLDEEAVFRKIASGEMPEPPAFLRSPAWERANRGLLAIAIKNQNDSFAKHYDLGRPDDAIVLSLFKGIDTWLLGVNDDDEIALHANAICRNREASAAVSRSLESLIKRWAARRSNRSSNTINPRPPKTSSSARMVKGLMASLRVEHTDNAITVQTQDFGTLADFAAVLEGQAKEDKARVAARKDAKNAVKR